MLDPEFKQEVLSRIHSVPVVEKLGIEILELDEGVCVARAPRNPVYDGIFESFHGGLLMTVADTIACWAVLTKTGADAIVTTTDMNIRFLAPCLTAVTAKAKVIKPGRTMNPVAVDLFDESGKHIAVAQINYMRLANMPKR